MNTPRTGTDTEPLTKKEADELRDYSMTQWDENGLPRPDYTCSTCVMLAWCEFAYDSYNTYGDCLATK